MNNWQQKQRPLRFVRVRLYQDTVDVIRDIMERAQSEEYVKLSELRRQGRSEDDPDVQEARRRLSTIIRFLADVDEGLIELVGPQAS
jgi:hypothetical protein